MAHTFTRAIDAAENLICRSHGTTSRECRSFHRAASIAVMAAICSSAGAAIGGKDGALVGGVIGLVVGAAYPETAEWVRKNRVATNMHKLGI